MAIANEFRHVLGDFIEHYAGLGPTNPDAPPVSTGLQKIYSYCAPQNEISIYVCLSNANLKFCIFWHGSSIYSNSSQNCIKSYDTGVFDYIPILS